MPYHVTTLRTKHAVSCDSFGELLCELLRDPEQNPQWGELDEDETDALKAVLAAVRVRRYALVDGSETLLLPTFAALQVAWVARPDSVVETDSLDEDEKVIIESLGRLMGRAWRVAA